jgi:hypothetical protein
MIADHAPLPSCLADQHPEPRRDCVGPLTIELTADEHAAARFVLDQIDAEREECRRFGVQDSGNLRMLEHTAAAALRRLVSRAP